MSPGLLGAITYGTFILLTLSNVFTKSNTLYPFPVPSLYIYIPFCSLSSLFNANKCPFAKSTT